MKAHAHVSSCVGFANQRLLAFVDDLTATRVLVLGACAARLLDRASATASEGWLRAKSGVPVQQQEAPPSARWTGFDADDSVGDTGSTDDRVAASAFSQALRADPSDNGSLGPNATFHLQKELCLLVDNTKLRRLLQRLRLGEDHVTLRRLQELRSPKTCHSWLWQLDPREGTILSEIDFTTAVRHRLGAEFVAEPVACMVCGQCMDVSASHALCCATGASTAGH